MTVAPGRERRLGVWCWKQARGGAERWRGGLQGSVSAPRVGEKGRPLVGFPGAAVKEKADTEPGSSPSC